MDRIEAPFTDEQVDALNAFQKACQFHPFTCPGDHIVCEQHRELIATNDGWVCHCGDYRQSWAHEFMAGEK